MAVVGSTGFVGSAIVRHLEGAGISVVAVRAPRLEAEFGGNAVDQAAAWAALHPDAAATLAAALVSADAVVNAAGIADATSGASPALWGANAVLPRVIADRLVEHPAVRYLHVSSAAVQGSRDVLDASPPPARTHSPYAASKAAGERAVLSCGHDGTRIVYRPTSVLGTDRAMTQTLARVLRSRWLLVPDVSVPLPITTDDHVASAVAFLLGLDAPPPIVMHPWEGVTTASLAAALGRAEPIRQLPRPLGFAALAIVRLVARAGPLAGHARRVELLWEGQRQRSVLPDLGFEIDGAETLAALARAGAVGVMSG